MVGVVVVLGGGNDGRGAGAVVGRFPPMFAFPWCAWALRRRRTSTSRYDTLTITLTRKGS